MTLAIIKSRASLGLETPDVLVEGYLTKGLPGMTLVGRRM
ncbi:magnesium chelatase [Pistricoccus aurantiacus]|uniref:Magnesium chelatase n=1 Tax=Pistricoccus aurantiacus TaxID=1883414 RepID=A0A5B8SMW0_9GAMM|nr:magnesium chelatase [Pistricoccus aurantiacus]